MPFSVHSSRLVVFAYLPRGASIGYIVQLAQPISNMWELWRTAELYGKNNKLYMGMGMEPISCSFIAAAK